MSTEQIEKIKSAVVGAVSDQLESKADEETVIALKQKTEEQDNTIKDLTDKFTALEQVQADTEAKMKSHVPEQIQATKNFDLYQANKLLKDAFASGKSFDFAEFREKTVNLGDNAQGVNLAIDDELGRTIIERARENVVILGLIGSKSVSSTTYREMVLKTYPTTAQGSEQTGATAPGDIWALTQGSTYVEVAMNVGKQYAKPQISDEVISDPAIDIFGHMQTLLAEEISRYWALQVIIGDNTANDNNLRGMLSTKRINATESVKDNASRNVEFYPVELSGIADSIGDADPTAANSAIDNIIDLTVALPSKYHKESKFVMNRRTLGLYRKLKDLEGRPLMSFSEGGFTLVGYSVAVEDYLPNVGGAPYGTAFNFPVIFGDLSKAYALVNIDDKFLVDPYSADGAVTLKYTSRKGDIMQNNDAIVVFATSALFPA